MATYYISPPKAARLLPPDTVILERLAKGLKSMPTLPRAVLARHRFSDTSYGEIAAELRVTVAEDEGNMATAIVLSTRRRGAKAPSTAATRFELNTISSRPPAFQLGSAGPFRLG